MKTIVKPTKGVQMLYDTIMWHEYQARECRSTDEKSERRFHEDIVKGLKSLWREKVGKTFPTIDSTAC